MKRILVSIVAAFLMLVGSNANAQVAIGAGYNLLFQSYDTSDPLQGFYIGADYTFAINKNIGVSSGAYLSYVTMGKYSPSGILAAEQRDSYVTIPVHVSYGKSLAYNLRGFVFAGPSFDIGLTNKTYSMYNEDGAMDLYKLRRYNRFDAKIGCGLGVDLNYKFRILGGYDYGLLDRMSKVKGTVCHSNRLYLGVAYHF